MNDYDPSFQMELEYLLRNMKNSGRPTASDTPGMGNLQQFKIPGSLPFPAQTMEDWGVQQGLNRQPGTQEQRFDLERWLMEQALKKQQEYNQSRIPKYQPPNEGSYYRLYSNPYNPQKM